MNSPLIRQVQEILQLGPVAYVGFVAGLCVLVLMMYLRAYRAFFLLLWVTVVFSGVPNDTLDSLFRVGRWVVIGAIAFLAVTDFRSPGGLAIVFAGLTFLGTLLGFVGGDYSSSMQLGLLKLVNIVLVGGALTAFMRTPDKLVTILKIHWVACCIWLSLAASGLSNLGEGAVGRLGIGDEGAAIQAFALAGSAFLPSLMLLAFISAQRNHRKMAVIASVTFCITVVAQVLSSQRTGVFAAGIACAIMVIPRLRRARFGFAVVVVVLLTMGLLGAANVLWPDQFEYVGRRYSESGLTGRFERWQIGFDACMASPVIGHGLGNSLKLTNFHSFYLSTWYDVGLIGLLGSVLLLWVGMPIVALRLASRTRKQPVLNPVSWYCLGMIAYFSAVGVVENLGSPSNVLLLNFVFLLVLLHCLKGWEQESAAGVGLSRSYVGQQTNDWRGIGTQ